MIHRNRAAVHHISNPVVLQLSGCSPPDFHGIKIARLCGSINPPISRSDVFNQELSDAIGPAVPSNFQIGEASDEQTPFQQRKLLSYPFTATSPSALLRSCATV
jgi:hypothetical protein